jgi:hypothetical protein
MSSERKFTIENESGPASSGFESCARIYTQADFLMIPGICAMATDAVIFHEILHRSERVHHSFTPDWVRGMEHLYKKSADNEKHPMRQAMLSLCFQNALNRRAIKSSPDFKGLIRREPRFARDWVLALIADDRLQIGMFQQTVAK